MTLTAELASEIQKLAPSARVELFEIDLSTLGDSVYRFHAGTNGLQAPLVWQGDTYTPWPAQATGFDFSSSGQLPRPKLVLGNVQGTITALVLTLNDCIGGKVTRKRTLAKFLDADNFPIQRNLLVQTENLRTTWFNTNSAEDIDVATAPDGANSADKLTETAVSATHAVSQTTTNASNVAQTFSVYLKAGERTRARLQIRDNAASANFVSAFFDLSAGTVVTSSAGGTATLTSATIEAVGNGWYRCKLSGTPQAAAGGVSRVVVWLVTATTTTTYLGVVGSGIYIWGAQLENGTTLTDYQYVGSSFNGNPSADPDAHFPDEIYYIDRKSSETPEVVEFELTAPFDVTGVKLPRRQIIQNLCPWRYRGGECGYAGSSYFNSDDTPATSLATDVCGKRLSSCKARFGESAELPFGGFPGAGLIT